MKSFEELFDELKSKVELQSANSKTVDEVNSGTHQIGKKIVEEAAEVWMAAEYEGKKRTVEEISQLIYHLQVMMLKNGITLEELYSEL